MMNFMPKSATVAIFFISFLIMNASTFVRAQDCATTESTNLMKSCSKNEDCKGFQLLGGILAEQCYPWATYVTGCANAEKDATASTDESAKALLKDYGTKCKSVETACKSDTKTGGCSTVDTATTAKPTTKSAATTNHGNYIVAVGAATAALAIFM